MQTTSAKTALSNPSGQHDIMPKRICITGAGIISALGIGIKETLSSLLDEKSGIEPISILDTEHRHFPVGEVRRSNRQLAAIAGVKAPANQLRTVLLGIIAAKEAISTARLTQSDITRAAFIGGTTVGGMDKTEQDFKEAFESKSENSSNLHLKYNDCGSSTDLIAHSIGDFRMKTTSSTACSSAANAIIFGSRLIKSGIVDIAVVGGSEALTRFHLNGFNSLMIISHEQCRPFDQGRTGINLGEGSAFLVIESLESARRRGASILGEISGYANACDAFHQTATSDDGEGPCLAMRKAIEMAGLTPKHIDYINAHGTGTSNNDESEFIAMERIWGDNIPPFSSTKAFTGHTTSASGAIESVISLLAITNDFLPANLGWRTPIKEHARPVTKTTPATLHHVVNNSFGFGGNDSSLIISKFLTDEK